MNLLIDIGNTNLHWAMQDAGVLRDPQAVRHRGGVPVDLLAAWESLAPPRRVLLANVGGAAVGAALARVSRAYWGLEPECAATRAHCLGVEVAYADPSRLGVDRWLTLLAARGRWPGPVLIVDAGTAVTYDLLLANGRHLGGLILPGVDLMRSALLEGTGIPRVDWQPATDPWGTDTGTAVAAGSVQALAALTDRLFDELARRVGVQPTLLLTGGDHERLAPAIGRPAVSVPDLVLRGLARFAEGCT